MKYLNNCAHVLNFQGSVEEDAERRDSRLFVRTVLWTVVSVEVWQDQMFGDDRWTWDVANTEKTWNFKEHLETTLIEWSEGIPIKFVSS